MVVGEKNMTVYCIDIDGILCHITAPHNYSKATPIWKNIAKVNKLYDEGNIIYFYTGRHMLREPVTKAWLAKYGVKYHHIFFGKPVADIYIDDKMGTL